jgi:ketosteroid isomerase-like protein
MLKSFSVVVLLLLAAAPLAVRAQPAPAADVQLVLERFVGAPGPEGLAAAAALLASDVLVYDEGLDGQPVRLRGKDSVRRFLEARAAALEAARSSLSDVVVRTTLDSAWIAATLSHEVSFDGQSESWKQLATFYLRKEGEDWKVAGWHASAAELPEMPYEGGEDELPPPSQPAPGGGPRPAATPPSRP